MLFQNEPASSFASSSKFSPTLCLLLHTIESLTNGCVGLGVTFKLVGCQITAHV